MFIAKIVTLTSVIWASSLFAGVKSYQLTISDTKGYAGEIFEAGTEVIFSNQSGQSLRLILDSNLPNGSRVVIPEGAELIAQDIENGNSKSIKFSVNGYYKMALEFEDGTVSYGEFAVIGDEIFDIKIEGIAFSPKQVTVKAGTWVRWVNTSRMKHTVTTDPSLASNPANAVVPSGATPWHSGEIGPGEVFIKQLTVKGDYSYFCKPHERMGHLGSITVEN